MKQFGTTNETPKLPEKLLLFLLNANKKQKYSISRYNEVRKGMCATSLFQNDTYNIDGYNGERIVHMGVDIYANPGTKVYSFMDGVIHSFGYNDAPGDYGYVVVVEYNVAFLLASLSAWAIRSFSAFSVALRRLVISLSIVVARLFRLELLLFII